MIDILNDFIPCNVNVKAIFFDELYELKQKEVLNSFKISFFSYYVHSTVIRQC